MGQFEIVKKRRGCGRCCCCRLFVITLGQKDADGEGMGRKEGGREEGNFIFQSIVTAERVEEEEKEGRGEGRVCTTAEYFG